MNLTGMIRLSIHFGDELKAKNLEVDFLVIDIPMAYNVILGHPTHYKVKAVIAPYLLQLQFEANDGQVIEMYEDQRTAWECYLVSIRPLVQRAKEHGPDGPSQAGKQATAGRPPTVRGALVICNLTLTATTGGR